MAATQRQNIFVVWLYWYFLEMPNFLLGVWKNYILFALNYLSLPVLLKSFLSPWRRYKWNYPKWYQVGDFLSTLVSNLFSRFLGAFMRFFLIIGGLIFQIFVIVAGLVIFVAWMFLPLLIIAGFWFVFIY